MAGNKAMEEIVLEKGFNQKFWRDLDLHLNLWKNGSVKYGGGIPIFVRMADVP